MDIIEEEIQYYKTSLLKKNKELDELLKKISAKEHEMESLKADNNVLKDEINKLSNKAKSLV